MSRMRSITLVLAALCAGACLPVLPASAASFNPPDTSVQLFKWKWTDIAKECTDWLGPQGYGAVQISPPSASKKANGWWDMYQPVNFGSLTSRMGNESELRTMIDACHAAGVRVYADVVVNQLADQSSAANGVATDGSSWDSGTLTYPQFSSSDFHTYPGDCTNADNNIAQNDYNGVNGGKRSNVLNCRMGGLPDLKTESSYVQSVIVTYLNKLLSLGVDGFRIDAAKHMPVSALQSILGTVKAAHPTTKSGESIWVTQEIIPDGTVTRSDYFTIGTLNEFQFTYAMRDIFRGANGLSLSSIPTVMGSWGNWGGSWNFISQPQYATVFVNNWDTERNGGSLSVHSDTAGTKRYNLANIFMLAQGYGEAQVQSGFLWTNANDDAPTASPYDANGNALINVNWDFVHRWADIASMVKFRSAVRGQPQTNWQVGSPNQIAFSRGNVGFVALNNDTTAWTKTFQTGLPAGNYRNVLGGSGCAIAPVVVDASGNATITVPANNGSAVPAVAIYQQQLVSAVDAAIPFLPGQPVVVKVTGSTVSLTWTSPLMPDCGTPLAGYNIYRNGTKVATSVSNAYTDTGLPPNTTYTYTVSYYDIAGNTSAQSPATSVTTTGIDLPPTPPTNLVIVNPTPGCVTINWTASTDDSGVIAYYEVYRNGVKVGTATTTSFTDCGLASAQTYTYTIIAVDPSGSRSAFSLPLSVTLPGNIASVYYKSTKLWATTYIHYGVNGTWSTVPGAPMQAACGPWHLFNLNLGSASSASVVFNDGNGTWDNNLSKNYTVEPGISAISNGVLTKGVNPCTDVPTVPSGLTASQVTSSSVTLGWTASTDVFGVVGYKVYRDGVQVGTSTGTSYTDSGVTTGSTSITYTVAAYNAVNTSPPSAPVVVALPCGTVNVTFTIANAGTVWGQNLYVVGNQTNLGNWTPAKGFALAIQGSGANVPWTGTVSLPSNTAVQYKYVKWDGTTAVWEGNQATASGNRVITTPSCGATLNQNDGSFKK